MSMKDIYFEDIHKAPGTYPYLDFNMKNINYLSHSHEEVELVYVVSGMVSAVTESGEKELSKGDICFFMPGEIHSFASAAPNSLYIFKLSSKAFSESFDFAFIRLLDNAVTPKHPLYSVFLSDIQEIAAEAKEMEPGYEFAVRSRTNHILMLIIRQLHYERIEITQKKALASRLAFLKEVNAYIDKNYESPISLEQMALHLNLSKYYFAHYFKEVTGIPFFEYLTRCRLTKAIDLISLSTDAMTEIAFKCGFSSTRSFNRMFKKEFGKTPTEYKRDLQSRDFSKS